MRCEGPDMAVIENNNQVEQLTGQRQGHLKRGPKPSYEEEFLLCPFTLTQLLRRHFKAIGKNQFTRAGYDEPYTVVHRTATGRRIARKTHPTGIGSI